MKTTQREAVYQAIVNVLADNGIKFDGGNVSEFLTKEYRGEVHAIICEGFKTSAIEFEATPANQEKLSSESKLSAYVSGLISNWIRKDTRLNGGSKYTAKNPGSRVGQSDEQMKTLRALAKQFVNDSEKLAVVNAQIEKRKMELAASKKPVATLTQEQIDALPADVRESLGF